LEVSADEMGKWEEAGTIYQDQAMLHMFLSFSVVSFLSIVKINLVDQGQVTLQLRVRAGIFLGGGGALMQISCEHF